MAKLLDGSEIAAYIKRQQYETVASMPRPPLLAIVHASADPATERYLQRKLSYASDIGVGCRVERLPQDITKVLAMVEQCNGDPDVTGIVVQLPLWDRRHEDQVLGCLLTAKDVDGLTPDSPFVHATALGMQWLLAAYGVAVAGRQVAVVGQGLVGRSTARLLAQAGAKVQVADVTTVDLAAVTLSADIIISATGQPGLIRNSLVKTGAVVVDAGISLVNGRVEGDAAPELFERPDIMITPNPGGVGPMTIAALFGNLLQPPALRTPTSKQ